MKKPCPRASKNRQNIDTVQTSVQQNSLAASRRRAKLVALASSVAYASPWKPHWLCQTRDRRDPQQLQLISSHNPRPSIHCRWTPLCSETGESPAERSCVICQHTNTHTDTHHSTRRPRPQTHAQSTPAPHPLYSACTHSGLTNEPILTTTHTHTHIDTHTLMTPGVIKATHCAHKGCG